MKNGTTQHMDIKLEIIYKLIVTEMQLQRVKTKTTPINKLQLIKENPRLSWLVSNNAEFLKVELKYIENRQRRRCQFR